MAETLIERIWAWLHATFPERQIYVRSEGRVQFFTFGPTLQATLSGLALIFLGWVAFASVNVIFKDRIIASKDHRYQQMRWSDENRIADLQQSYDELNGALVAAEDRFKSKADELEAKQETVSRLLNRKQAVDSIVAGLRGSSPDGAAKTQDADTAPIAHATGPGLPSDSVGSDFGPAPSGGSQLSPMPQNPQPQPRTGRPTKASFLDEAVSRFAATFFHVRQASTARRAPNLPALRVLAAETDRISRLSGSETALLVGVDREVSGRIADLQTILRRVGVDSNSLEQQATGGIGGPFIPIQAMRLDGISDNAFTAAYVGASAHEKELNALFTALNHVPLTTPVHGQQFEITSDFGPRVDPFTRRIAFHPGLDFGGPWGAPVVATAPGIVVFAGNRGGYGNMVEIDHGYGFRTRYGHLSQVLVRVGAKVQKGSPVGKLGSTGRSTGPHVHYEVWLDDVVRDPSRFIEAGRHVFQ
ncbi:MAG TPA: M23 family metallopeptidase [Rhizomicrobium sp.]|nr:M23 family metallopeptidase [Rhizomicrobium sp.]